METDHHRIYLLPGPKLEKLISDQAEKLKSAWPQVERMRVTLWAEDIRGMRKKSCELSLSFDGHELHITRHGATHILALLDALGTARKRIARLRSRIRQAT